MITAELLKADLEFTTGRVQELIDWSLENVPRKWKRGLIIKIPKKGNLRECKNWRGVTLLPVVSKILGRIVIDRIRMGIDRRLRTEQAGFGSGRGTTEHIFILRNVLEQVNEWQASHYINFIDFEKAFESMHRNGLCMIMDRYGILQKIINIVKALYEVKLDQEWNSSNVSRKTKSRLYKTLVKPVLVYGCETWKMNEGEAKKIDVFQNRCLRKIMKIRWQDKISNR